MSIFDSHAHKMDPYLLLFGVLIVVLSSLIRLYYLAIQYGRPYPKRSTPCKTVVVIGAGGHGMEMMNILSGLDPAHYTPRVYVVARNDAMSRKKVQQFESKEQELTIWGIMRAREVGQSYISSVFTTIGGFIHSLPLFLITRPDLILCNGPGTCIPVCLAGYLFKFFGLKSLRTVYVESVCRTEDLSLSAKILYYLCMADEVIVQWPQLVDRYPRTRYLGRLI